MAVLDAEEFKDATSYDVTVSIKIDVFCKLIILITREAEDLAR
jgi:hypothetical protein